jgi:hypothetical protein
MADEFEDVTSRHVPESEAVEAVRSAWLALLGLLADEVIRHLAEGGESEGDDQSRHGSERPPRPIRRKGRPSGRSQDQGMP